MALTNTILSYVLNVNMVCEDRERYVDENGVKHLEIHGRPKVWYKNKCPICGATCPGYDPQLPWEKTWRDTDWGDGTVVEIKYRTHRIQCEKDGILVADVPWAFRDSSFTRSFDMQVAWLVQNGMPRSKVCELMRIDWKTVGRCISRVREALGSDLDSRLKDLVNIGIDETSYKKGHSYITVVINHDTQCVVWAAPGCGTSVLTQFFELLTKEQRENIKVVTGDGAKWITECVKKFLPNATRCVDPFHVVEWALEALDKVRLETWNAARSLVQLFDERIDEQTAQEGDDNATKKGKKRKKGKGKSKTGKSARQDIDPKIGEYMSVEEMTRARDAAEQKAKDTKGAKYALGKAPEDLTGNQQAKLELIASTDKRLFRAYQLKETLRLILKLQDVDEAEAALKKWMWWASHSRIPAMHDLYLKIKRNKDFILNTIRLGFSNARVEATNNKIKLTIRTAYGFRNVDNMIDLIYLICSNIRIPLPNRSPKKLKTA